jgi:acyl transferase domain-containing protein
MNQTSKPSGTPVDLSQLSPLKVALAAQRMRSKLEVVTMEPIAIVGMGCRFPGGANHPDAFWQLLKDGTDAIGEIPPSRWNLDAYHDSDPDAIGKIYVQQAGFIELLREFDAEFFNISPREMKTIDPQQRLLLEVAWEALESAALAPDKLNGSKAGVFVGLEKFDYFHQLLDQPPEKIDAYTVSGNIHSVAAGRLSYILGLEGPAVTVDTACSSSLVALHLAVMSLRQGECDLALAGGANHILSPEFMVGVSRARMLSRDGRCKTFDAAADGMARAEGCGVIVLKRLSDAIADKDRILALIRGSAINHDGHTSGLTVPSGLAQQRVIRQALQNAGLKPSQIDYVEAHGTGTSLGDPIEVEALGQVFAEGRQPDRPLLIGSVKTNIGHAEVASGIAGLIKVVLSLKHEEIPPHLHFHQPNPHIDWSHLPIRVTKERTPWPSPTGMGSRFAGVSSFGMSGTNAHLIIEQAPILSGSTKQEALAERCHMLTLSAKTEAALDELLVRYEQHLTTNPEQALSDICFTANIGRSHFQRRAAICATTGQELRQKLAACISREEQVGVLRCQTTAPPPKIAFLFTGQGSQYPGMGRQLYETEPVFRQTLEQCSEILHPLDVPLLSILYPKEEQSRIHQTAYTQPALFALEYALAQLWRSWGIKPGTVIGHSVGEYVAACIAGVFSLEDGLKLIAGRGRLMGALPEGGSMMSVMTDIRRLEQAIAPLSAEVSVAAINGPRSLVISGEQHALAMIADQLAEDGIKTTPLKVSHAFHSPLMEPILGEFRQLATSIAYHKPALPLISNLTGKREIDALVNPDYWVRHLRQTVRFGDGIRALRELGNNVYLEIGPKPSLLGMARLSGDDRSVVTYLPSLRENGDDSSQMLASLGELYVRGATPDWEGIHKDRHGRKLALPFYPFQREHHWVEASSWQPAVRASHTTDDSSITRLLKEGKCDQVVDAIDLAAFSPDEQKVLPKLLAMVATQHQQELATATTRERCSASRDWREWLYRIEWQPQPLDKSGESHQVCAPQQDGSDEPWLILADREGLGARVAAELSMQGKPTILAVCGSEYEAPQVRSDYLVQHSQLQIATIDPQQPQHCQWLLDELQPRHSGARINVIYFAKQEMPPVEMPEKVLRLSGGLLHLAQALAQTELPTKGPQAGLKPRLWVITENAQGMELAVPPSLPRTQQIPEKVRIEQRPLWGLMRTILAEYPHWQSTCVDLERGEERDQVPLLLEEMRVHHRSTCIPAVREDQIVYRGGERYVARLVRMQTIGPQTRETSSEASTLKIHPDGCYLITGGLGGLGLSVARQLIACGARHLVLAGRRGVASSKIQETVLQLQASGAKVDVVKADVAIESDVVRLLAVSGPLRGIIHAAGIADEGLLGEQHLGRFNEVFGAKVIGTWNLHRKTCDMPPDFFVCFSSMSAILETVGISGYAAANAFQDGIMQQRKLQGLPGLSINWGIWAEVGMAASEQKQYHQMGLIPPEQGAEISVALALRPPEGGSGQVAVTSVNWSEFYDTLYPKGSCAPRGAPGFLKALIGEKPLESSAPSALRMELQSATKRKRDQRLMSYLQSEVARVLNLPRPPSLQQGFLDMGMDSLMLVEFSNRLHSELGLTLPSTLLFKYQTLAELTEHLSALLAADENAAPRDRQQATDKSAPSTEDRDVAIDEGEQLIAEKFQALTSLLDD